MSAALMGRAMWLTDITMAQKMVLVAIADVASDTGMAYMLIETLMSKSSGSRRCVQDALAVLIEKRILARKIRRNQSSIFKINVARLPTERPPISEREHSGDEWGAFGAPHDEGGAPPAPGGASGAPPGASGAPIYLLDTGPTQEKTLPTEGQKPLVQNLFGDEVEAPEIPLHDRVVEAWNEMVRRYPGIAAIGVLNDDRKKKILARANSLKKAKLVPDLWTAWERVLTNIQANTFLCGEDEPGKGYTDPLRLTIDRVLRPAEFVRIFEGGYRANRTHETHDLNSGRRYGPSEQAGRANIASIRAAFAEPGDGADGGGGAVVDDAGGGRGRRLRSAFDQYGIDPTR